MGCKGSKPKFDFKGHTIVITFVSDFNNPLCYITWRLLDEAMRELKQTKQCSFRVNWEPLIFSIPGIQKPVNELIDEMRYNTADPNMLSKIKEFENKEEDEAAFLRKHETDAGYCPDTRKAHALMIYAAGLDMFGDDLNAVAERIFKSVFHNNSALDDTELKRIADRSFSGNSKYVPFEFDQVLSNQSHEKRMYVQTRHNHWVEQINRDLETRVTADTPFMGLPFFSMKIDGMGGRTFSHQEVLENWEDLKGLIERGAQGQAGQ